jgi:guanylate kinase
MGSTVAILLWVSGSWKTTIQEELINNYWFIKPITFTTRQPRSKKIYDVDRYWDFNCEELDEYVFISEAQFIKKIKNWDFAEYNNYNWNWYWKSKYINKDKNNCLIVEPLWYISLMRYFNSEWIPYISFYIDIDEETQEYRLWVLRRENYTEITKRKKDFEYFKSCNYDKIIDWSLDIKTISEIIIKNLWILEKNLI